MLSGEERRISRLLSAVGDTTLDRLCFLDLIGERQMSGSSSNCEDTKTCRCITFYKTSRPRSANGWDPNAPMTNLRNIRTSPTP